MTEIGRKLRIRQPTVSISNISQTRICPPYVIFPDGSTRFTFIDAFPDRMHILLAQNYHKLIKILKKNGMVLDRQLFGVFPFGFCFFRFLTNYGIIKTIAFIILLLAGG